MSMELKTAVITDTKWPCIFTGPFRGYVSCKYPLSAPLTNDTFYQIHISCTYFICTPWTWSISGRSWVPVTLGYQLSPLKIINPCPTPILSNITLTLSVRNKLRPLPTLPLITLEASSVTSMITASASPSISARVGYSVFPFLLVIFCFDMFSSGHSHRGLPVAP